jgi:hypothetical protein
VLAHAEIVVRAPHRDLGADAVVEGARKAPAAPLEIGKDAIPPLGVQRVEALSEGRTPTAMASASSSVNISGGSSYPRRSTYPTPAAPSIGMRRACNVATTR